MGIPHVFDRVPFVHDKPASGLEQARHHARPPIEVVNPRQGPASGVDEAGAAVEATRHVEHVAADPQGVRPERVRLAPRLVEHRPTDIDADHLVDAEPEKRERVLSVGALEVHGASDTGQVPEQASIEIEQAAATRTQIGHVALDIGLVLERGAVPGDLVGGDELVGILHGRRVRCRRWVIAARSAASGARHRVNP